MCTQSANEDSFISLGLYYCISVLREPIIRLVGAMEMSHTAAHSDENFTCFDGFAQQFITALSHKCSRGLCALWTGGCNARLLQLLAKSKRECRLFGTSRGLAAT